MPSALELLDSLLKSLDLETTTSFASMSQQDSTNNRKLPPNVELLNSKAIDCLFSVIRNKNTKNEDYVFYSDRLCRILAEEGLARLSTSNEQIETPCGKWLGPKVVQ